MDEVFRNAGENYPLNTGTADWDNLLSKMETGFHSPVIKPINFLQPLAILVIVLLFPMLVYDLVHLSPSHLQILESTPGNNISSHAIRDNVNNQIKTPGGALQPGQKTKPVLSDSKINYVAPTSQPAGIEPIRDYVREEPANINAGEITGLKHNAIQEQVDSAIKQPFPAEAVPSKNITAVPGRHTDQKKQKYKHVYVGVIVGPDATSVKLQPVKKTGLKYGVLVGYAFNKKWSVETGLLWDKKYYYTNGKYFSRKNISLPGYIKIDYADGFCNMLEIPLNIHYRFAGKNSNGWYALAGLSSYLMKKEQYTYGVTRYGNSYERDYTYNKDRNYFLSVINLGIGFNRQLGKAGTLRLEPYIQLPIDKVGTGSLPLQSAGIHLGFIRPLF